MVTFAGIGTTKKEQVISIWNEFIMWYIVPNAPLKKTDKMKLPITNASLAVLIVEAASYTVSVVVPRTN